MARVLPQRLLNVSTKTLSTVSLVAATFFLIFMWFRRGIFGIWDSLGFDPSQVIEHARPEIGVFWDAADRDQFAMIAAVSHTLVLLLGMACYSAVKRCVASPQVPVQPSQGGNGQQHSSIALQDGLPDSPTKRNASNISGKKPPVLLSTNPQAHILGITLITVLFYLVTQEFFVEAFKNKHLFPYKWARSFFYDEGHLPFSHSASVSYSLCLLCGYGLKLTTNQSRFSAFPRCYRRWVWKVFGVFVVSLFFFRFAVIPAWQLMRSQHVVDVDPNDAEVHFKFVSMATITHTLALVAGMVTSALSLLTWKICGRDSIQKQEALQPPAASTETVWPENIALPQRHGRRNRSISGALERKRRSVLTASEKERPGDAATEASRIFSSDDDSDAGYDVETETTLIEGTDYDLQQQSSARERVSLASHGSRTSHAPASHNQQQEQPLTGKLRLKALTTATNTISLRFALAATSWWLVSSVGFVAFYFGATKAIKILRHHIQSFPETALFASLLVWFVWGYLLIADKLPNVLRLSLDIFLLPLKATRHRPNSAMHRAWQYLVIYLMYNLQMVVVFVLVSTFALAAFYPEHVMLFWVVVILRYAKTYRNNPGLTGCRQSRDILRHWIFDEIAEFFSVSIYSQAPASSFHKRDRYLFCHHPHGVLPISAGFIPHCSAWKSACNTISPVPASSSVLHHVPLMRDFLQLMGGADVSKAGIAAAFKRNDSVVLIPGGHQELLSTSSTTKWLQVCSKHKGFIRLAYQLASASDKDFHLVPLYNFGEQDILDNVQAPMAWQRAAVKSLRANVFFLPLGYFNLPGLTRRRRMTTAIAKPITVPRIEKPTKEQVSLLHRRYFTALREVFEDAKETAGHPEKELVLDEPIEPLSEQDWIAASEKFPTERATVDDVDAMFTGAGDLLERIATGIFWVVVFAAIFAHAYLYLDEGIWATLFH